MKKRGTGGVCGQAPVAVNGDHHRGYGAARGAKGSAERAKGSAARAKGSAERAKGSAGRAKGSAGRAKGSAGRAKGSAGRAKGSARGRGRGLLCLALAASTLHHAGAVARGELGGDLRFTPEGVAPPFTDLFGQLVGGRCERSRTSSRPARPGAHVRRKFYLVGLLVSLALCGHLVGKVIAGRHPGPRTGGLPWTSPAHPETTWKQYLARPGGERAIRFDGAACFIVIPAMTDRHSTWSGKGDEMQRETKIGSTKTGSTKTARAVLSSRRA